VSATTDLPAAVVAIGASAGGLQAYTELLEALPATTGMAFVIVQHLAAGHESFLATLLGRITSMPVVEVQDGPRVEPNTIYVIPPNRSMVIDDGHLRLRERDPGIHLSVDIFFNALAASHGPRAIGIVLSGTGSDGMKGIEAIKAAGGITFAQDESAQQSGMPHSAVNTGCVDFVMSPRQMAIEIAKLASVPDLAFSADPVEPSENVDSLLRIVHARLNIDFSQYKTTTLHRRIRRRMALSRTETLEAYEKRLLEKPEEVQALGQDILISVTSFFRDPESFEALKSTVFPRLLARDSSEDPIRVWVVGCSTGEEAYSLAISLLETMEETQKQYPLSVFGTDVNAQSIERARRGWFPKAIEADVSQERLHRFFTEMEGGYCVTKLVRELCVFAPHNALNDPPFSRMDLVSCRNLLIYFQGGPQRRLLPLLHYALKPHGTLFLGASESINNYRDLFDQEDSKHKLYVKRPVSNRLNEALARIAPSSPTHESGARKLARPGRDRQIDRRRTAEVTALRYFAPPGVLVDAQGEILQFRGNTSPYLTQSDGRASLNLLKIAREGLFSTIRSGLQHAAAETRPMRTEGVIVRTETGLATVSVIVIPVVYPSSEERSCWLFFQPSVDRPPGETSPPASEARLDADTARQIVVLTDELMATRDHLEATIQDQESANEDLQAANEEVQSANEELQSTNEELETSKEEIQSTNEELSTVNDELRQRNDELDRANSDLLNLFSSVQMAVVMVWPDLTIRRFTPLAEKLFNIRPTDVGRSIAQIHHQIDIADFPTLLIDSIERGRDIETEVRSLEGHCYLLRLRPYRNQDRSIDGAIVLLIDIDTLAKTREALSKRVVELAAADRHKNEFLAILAHELRNPLAPLRNAVHMLRRSPGDAALTVKARDLIDRQVHHMSRLVSDLLDAARASNGQIQLQRTPLDLRTCLAHAIELMEPQFEIKQQSLRVSLPEEAVWIDGDAVRLEQVFTNLLSNATKYTQDRGDVEVTLSTTAASDDKRYAVIRVVDNGEGIDAELVPRLFELFTQADRSLAHSQGGLGIGLSLVRTIVELHGGRVAIKSEGHGKGTVFEVRIPAAGAPAAAVPPALEERVEMPVATRPRRVLVVDDNQDIRESTSELLVMAGFEVKSASTGSEALDLAPAFGPASVLLDVGLPDLSGYDVARRLRAMPQLAGTLLIALTGYDTPESHTLSAAAGFDHHIAKPVNFDDLVVLLSRQ
jgi:two-component system CheB/CheR fusion protein